MFAFEDYVFNLAMLEHIHVIPGKVHDRVILTFYNSEIVFEGEQADRFVKRAREAKWLDPPALNTTLVLPTAPLHAVREQRGG